MKPWIPALAAAAATGAVALSTDYTKDRALRVETRSAMELETTSAETTVDGEPVERPFGGGSSSSTHRIVTKDVVLAHADGRPTKVRRTFETLEGSSATSFGERDFTTDFESELEGVTLELVLEDGEVVAEVVDGDEPSREEALEGHGLTLLLDAFLPAGDVEVDATWDLASETILHGLGAGMQEKLFQRAAQGDAGGEGRGRRGGGRMGGRGVGSMSQLDWEGEAKLVAADAEHEGAKCAVVELKLEGRGELPMPEMRGGGGRRERSAAPAVPSERVRGIEMEVELEGRLLFDVESRRPVKLELEGPVRIDTLIESNRGERAFVMEQTQQGTLTHTVVVTEASKDA